MWIGQNDGPVMSHVTGVSVHSENSVSGNRIKAYIYETSSDRSETNRVREDPPDAPSPEPFFAHNKMDFHVSADRWLTRNDIATSQELDTDFTLGLQDTWR